MSEVNVTTIDVKPNQPKDDFVLASESQAKKESAAPEEILDAKVAATPEVVETEEVKESDSKEDDSLEASEKKDEPKKKKGGFQRRVDKLTREKEELRRDNELLRAKAAALDVQRNKPAGETDTSKTVDLSKRPTADQFEKHEDFIEALTDWKVDQKDAAKQAAAREDAVKSEMKSAQQKHIDRVKEFEKANPDFQELMEDIRDMRLQQSVHNSIIDSDFGPALMYEFAKNPEELTRINSLSPEAAARAIGRLEAKFEATSSGSKKNEVTTTPSEKKVTSAPKPISTINSKVGHAKSTRDSLPYDEWAPLRRAEMKARGS